MRAVGWRPSHTAAEGGGDNDGGAADRVHSHSHSDFGLAA